ncbi:hypothetical protein DPMN_140608 [Dreissena polymorpha]|uniref:Uncharacterized protein n=1 Tax=Dreissena polymorpha TaxID=45954 RepID=A0A9D4G7X5_DREPO|nr:hypothetical protein DPMN_140608 [Dreissena polymorpha]
MKIRCGEKIMKMGIVGDIKTESCSMTFLKYEGQTGRGFAHWEPLKSGADPHHHNTQNRTIQKTLMKVRMPRGQIPAQKKNEEKRKRISLQRKRSTKSTAKREKSPSTCLRSESKKRRLRSLKQGAKIRRSKKTSGWRW